MQDLTSEAGSYARPPELLVRLIAGAHPDPGAGHHPPRPRPALQHLPVAGALLLLPGGDGVCQSGQLALLSAT